MVTQQLIDFIRTQRAAGISKEAITASLASSGWLPQDIAAGLTATDPVAPAKTPVGFAPAAGVVQPTQPMQPAQTAQPLQPIQPMQPMQKAQPVQPTTAAQPVQPLQPMQPVAQPIQPMQPIVTAQPTIISQPLQPIQPAPMTQPIQPTQPIQVTQPVRPAQTAQPQAVQQKKGGSMVWIISIVIIFILLLAGAWGAAYWYRQNIQSQASSSATPVANASTASTTAVTTASTTTTSLFTYPFTPNTSTMPGFSMQYPSLFGIPQVKGSSSGVTVAFNNSFVLTFDLSAKPLSTLQTLAAYVQSKNPTATSTDVSANGRAILQVPIAPTATSTLTHSAFYILLKNQKVLTITSSGGSTPVDENAIVQSIQFTDQTY